MSEMKGILLINTGSPSGPSVREVKCYLRQFLMDPYVIDLPFWKRWLLVHGIILRTRPKLSAKNYKTIWTPEGSPLLAISRRQCRNLEQQTGIPTTLGFRYGTPSIEDGLRTLMERGCDSLTALPLFPQYSQATTESIRTELLRVSQKYTANHTLRMIPPFWNHPDYLEAWINSVKSLLHQEIEHLLISFHGLPERHLRKADPSGHTCLSSADCCSKASPEVLNRCYRAQSIYMTRALVQALGLNETQYSLCYQSRLGRDPWLAPSAHETVIRLCQRGVKNLVVVAPSFITDCLETLYEIQIELHQTFHSFGGKTFDFLPCLNDSVEWMAKVIETDSSKPVS